MSSSSSGADRRLNSTASNKSGHAPSSASSTNNPTVGAPSSRSSHSSLSRLVAGSSSSSIAAPASASTATTSRPSAIRRPSSPSASANPTATTAPSYSSAASRNSNRAGSSHHTTTNNTPSSTTNPPTIQSPWGLPAGAQQYASSNALLQPGARSRSTIAPTSSRDPPPSSASTAATPNNASSQSGGAGGNSSGGGGGGRGEGGGGSGSISVGLRRPDSGGTGPRASPSLSISAGFGSPGNTSTPTSATAGAGGGLAKITIAQVSLILGSLKEDGDKAKFTQQVERLRKLLETGGMEVFPSYFRRLILQNAGAIFLATGASQETHGSYQILVSEMQKITSELNQAQKIADSLDTTQDGDIFKDFDLSTFIDHFRLDPLAKTKLALAIKKTNKPNLKSKADPILLSNYQALLVAISTPERTATDESDSVSPPFLSSIVEDLFTEPPRTWNEDNKNQLVYAVRMRYRSLNLGMPVEVSGALQLSDLMAAPNGLVRILAKPGPSCTNSMETCKEALAQADTRDISYQQVANALLYMLLSQGGTFHNVTNFVSALREHRAGQRLDWQDVVHTFDREGLNLARPQFLSLYRALLPIAQETDFDIQGLWGGTWSHSETQLNFLVAFLSCAPEDLDVSEIPRFRPAFTAELYSDASEGIKEYAQRAAKHPMASLDAVSALFHMIFRSHETYAQAQSLGIPALVINPHMDLFVVSTAAVPKPWIPLQEQAFTQVFNPFFAGQAGERTEFVLRGVWKQDTLWLEDRLARMYRESPGSLIHIFDHARQYGWLESIIDLNNDLSLDLAALAHGQGIYDFETWARTALQRNPEVVAGGLRAFLHAKMQDEEAIQRQGVGPTTMRLYIKTIFVLVTLLSEIITEDDALVSLQRMAIHNYPRLVNYGEGFDELLDELSKSPDGAPDNQLPPEADAKMQDHFKDLYNDQTDVKRIIEVLQEYKHSREPAQQEIFACMIQGLFDEYHCFATYPIGALATTAVLFGGVINFNLLSRIALQAALGMVLEAITTAKADEPMFKFGLQALLHFKDRLTEWPSLCERLTKIPELKDHEIGQIAAEVVRSQKSGDVNGDGPNGTNSRAGDGGNVDDFLAPEPSVPHFTAISPSPPLRGDSYEEPDEETQDKVLFAVNNISERNLEAKFRDLSVMLEEKHHQWFASYLVEERAKTEPNYHHLYLEMLVKFNDKMLWAEVLRETYVIVQRTLNAETTMDSTTERSHLKNLAKWLGQQTLARNKPIKFRNISFKDLLLEGYNTQRLLLVIPFTCNVLIQAAKSVIFKPPNPWLMEIVRMLVELYYHAELKINMKFDIEVLLRELTLDLNKITPSDTIRSRQPTVDELGLPDGMPEGYGGEMAFPMSGPRPPGERFSISMIDDQLPELEANMKFPPAATMSQQQQNELVIAAVRSALQEIVPPVVERSVTIASIETAQMVAKDFILEPDEEKLRRGAQATVKSTSGSLALATCKDPLKHSIGMNIRKSAPSLGEGLILMFCNDNMDEICKVVERASETHSLRAIESYLQGHIEERRQHKQQRPNEPFVGGPVSPWSGFIPDPYKIQAGGLNAEQMALYESFSRLSRGTQHAAGTSQDTGRQVPDVLQESYASLPNLPTPAGEPATARHTQNQRMQPVPPVQPSAQQPQLNGFQETDSIEQRLQDLITNLQHTARGDGDREAQNALIVQILMTIDGAGQARGDIAMHAAKWATDVIFERSTPVNEMAGLAMLLSQLCRYNFNVEHQVTVYLTHNDEERLLNAQAIGVLVRFDLVGKNQVDEKVARLLNAPEPEKVRQGAAFFNEIINLLLLNEQPRFFRADFPKSFEAIALALAKADEAGEEELPELREVAHQLSAIAAVANNGSISSEMSEYVFAQWISLQRPDVAEVARVAFVHQLFNRKVISNNEKATHFLRTCLEASVEGYEKEEKSVTGNIDDAYLRVDALATLVVTLTAHHRPRVNGDVVNHTQADFLDSALCLFVSLIWHQNRIQPLERFKQRVFYRLFSSILSELSARRAAFEGGFDDLVLRFGKAVLALQPKWLPKFAFGWFGLVFHRILIPSLLRMSDSAGWKQYALLIQTLLSYTVRMKLAMPENPDVSALYDATLRGLLVLHHDVPEFLAENHFAFCNVIPRDFMQFRNLITSAYPASIPELPDPFTIGLKAERLEEARHLPVIRDDIEIPLKETGIFDILDSMLSSSGAASESEAAKILASLKTPYLPTDGEVNITALHALVLYIGNAAFAQSQSQTSKNNTSIFDPSSSPVRILETLIRLASPAVRYHILSAIANQLRYPNAHTIFFTSLLLHIFSQGGSSNDEKTSAIKNQLFRSLLERIIAHRPHPWGLIITLYEMVKNPAFAFWDLPFVKADPGVEKICGQIFRGEGGMAAGGRGSPAPGLGQGMGQLGPAPGLAPGLGQNQGLGQAPGQGIMPSSSAAGGIGDISGIGGGIGGGIRGGLGGIGSGFGGIGGSGPGSLGVGQGLGPGV